jgi:hypothetical protein
LREPICQLLRGEFRKAKGLRLQRLAVDIGATPDRVQRQVALGRVGIRLEQFLAIVNGQKARARFLSGRGLILRHTIVIVRALHAFTEATAKDTGVVPRNALDDTLVDIHDCRQEGINALLGDIMVQAQKGQHRLTGGTDGNVSAFKNAARGVGHEVLVGCDPCGRSVRFKKR